MKLRSAMMTKPFKIKSSKGTAKVITTFTHNFETIELDKKHVAFKITTEKRVEETHKFGCRTETTEGTDLKLSVSQGVCTKSHYAEQLKAGKLPRSMRVYAFSKQQLDYAAHYRFCDIFTPNSNLKPMPFFKKDGKTFKKHEYCPHIEFMALENVKPDNADVFITQVFDILVENPERVETLTVVDISTHTLKSLSGGYFPTALLVGNYSGLSSHCYHLNEVAEALFKRKDTTIQGDRFSRRDELKYPQDLTRPFPSDDEPERRCIDLLAKLSAEDFQKLVERSLKNRKYVSPTTLEESLHFFDVLDLNQYRFDFCKRTFAGYEGKRSDNIPTQDDE